MHIEWKIVPSCCRMLIGLETSRIVAAVLEPQKTFGGLDILVFGSVLVMTDDSYAENSCVVCWHPRGCAEYRLHPSHQNTSWNERWDITCPFTKVHSITYVTRTGAASTWKTCTVTATTTTWFCLLWSTRSTHVKLMWRPRWRLVCFCVWRRMEKCAQSELLHVSLVKKPHVPWVWSGSATTRRSLEMNRSVRRKRSDCVKEMQNNIYYNTDFSSLVGE